MPIIARYATPDEWPWVIVIEGPMISIPMRIEDEPIGKFSLVSPVETLHGLSFWEACEMRYCCHVRKLFPDADVRIVEAK